MPCSTSIGTVSLVLGRFSCVLGRISLVIGVFPGSKEFCLGDMNHFLPTMENFLVLGIISRQSQGLLSKHRRH